jgi:hypothetical protein
MIFLFLGLHGANVDLHHHLPHRYVRRQGGRPLVHGQRQSQRPRGRGHGGLRLSLHSAFHGIFPASPGHPPKADLQRGPPFRRHVRHLVGVNLIKLFSSSIMWERIKVERLSVQFLFKGVKFKMFRALGFK